MYLTAYHFDGPVDHLLTAYERMLASMDTVTFQVCVRTVHGISVYDGCPTAEIAQAFRTSPEFKAALAALGLPEPRIEPLGDVHRTVVSETVER